MVPRCTKAPADVGSSRQRGASKWSRGPCPPGAEMHPSGRSTRALIVQRCAQVVARPVPSWCRCAQVVARPVPSWCRDAPKHRQTHGPPTRETHPSGHSAGALIVQRCPQVVARPVPSHRRDAPHHPQAHAPPMGATHPSGRPSGAHPSQGCTAPSAGARPSHERHAPQCSLGRSPMGKGRGHVRLCPIISNTYGAKLRARGRVPPPARAKRARVREGELERGGAAPLSS
jgi:hypothetical protein